MRTAATLAPDADDVIMIAGLPARDRDSVLLAVISREPIEQAP